MPDDQILQLMSRAEAGLQHAADATILFNALKSAAVTQSDKTDILKFLTFHIQNGIEEFKLRTHEH